MEDLHSLNASRAREWSTSLRRADLAEQTLLRSADAIESGLDFTQTRVESACKDTVEAVAAIARRLPASSQRKGLAFPASS